MLRAAPIDLLRGFIMMLMALDHASALIARTHFMEFWGIKFKGYPDLAWWFTRFASHLCAPGFFFLMGMSVVLFATKRSADSWSTNQIRSYIIKRAALIIGFMYFLEFPAWALGNFFKGQKSIDDIEIALPGGYEGGLIFPSSVLFGLAICMIISIFIWKLQKHGLLLLTILCFAISTFIIPQQNPAETFHALEIIFLVPGISGGVMNIYPIIPWLGIASFGMFWAKLYLENPARLFKISFFAGLGFILTFLLLRFMEIGNFHFRSSNNWIEFFTLVKYPPSITFALITSGLNLLFLALFSKISNWKILYPVLIIGQTALFFYVAHLYVYALIGAFYPKGCSVQMLYFCWFFGLILLYFICNSFLKFKKSKPSNSNWRLI